MYFTEILYKRTKLLKLTRKKFSEILDTKGGEPKFQIWGGGKKGRGTQIFQKEGNQKKFFGVGEKKGGGKIFKNKGGGNPTL